MICTRVYTIVHIAAASQHPAVICTQVYTLVHMTASLIRGSAPPTVICARVYTLYLNSTLSNSDNIHTNADMSDHAGSLTPTTRKCASSTAMFNDSLLASVPGEIVRQKVPVPFRPLLLLVLLLLLLLLLRIALGMMGS